MWNPELALFPFTTTVRDGAYLHQYDHPLARRYTINTLLGLGAFARANPDVFAPAEVDSMTWTFWRRHQASVGSTGDLGLLLVHLSQNELDPRLVGEVLERLRSEADHLRRGNVQELSWILWGASCLAREHETAASIARATLETILHDYAGTAGLARHTTSRYRRNLVSFGSSVYYLRGLYEYGVAAEDEAVLDRFANGAKMLLAAQGPLGEWPWMFDVRTAQPTDFYPVFAVHQDAMAMLFLFPALALNIQGAQSAIERSLSWCFGENELGISMYKDTPFVAHRSIERGERLSRLRRYARSVGHSPTAAAATTGVANLRLNPECRSYHLGWMLFVWSASPKQPVDAQRLEAMSQIPQ